MDFSGFSSLERIDDDAHVVELRLDHGRVNACGSAVIAEFEELARRLAAAPEARVLILRSDKASSKGAPIFVAGADVTERADWSDAEVIAHVRRQRGALLALRALPLFTIVVVDGLALGLGTELMLAFDYRIASPAARFGLPETGLGIIPGALGSTLLADVIGQHHALRLGCTGERINANEAQRLGLVDELQDSPEAARARARELATLVASKAPRAVAAFKGAMLELGASPALDSRVVREAASYEAQVRNGDAALGRANFKRIVAGEAPDWPPRSAEIVEAKP